MGRSAKFFEDFFEGGLQAWQATMAESVQNPGAGSSSSGCYGLSLGLGEVDAELESELINKAIASAYQEAYQQSEEENEDGDEDATMLERHVSDKECTGSHFPSKSKGGKKPASSS